jgi:hypothetical protein
MVAADANRMRHPTQGQSAPDIAEPLDQRLDVGVGVQRRRRQRSRSMPRGTVG